MNALLKSAMYHGYGQLRDEQITTLVLAGLSVPFLLLTLARLARHRRQGQRKLITMTVVCAFVVGRDALALWNLSTATMGAKDLLQSRPYYPHSFGGAVGRAADP